MTAITSDAEPARLHVVRRPAVDTEGPYDEVYATSPASLADSSTTSGSLALALPLPIDPVIEPARPAPLRLLPPMPGDPATVEPAAEPEGDDELDDTSFHPVRTSRAELPAPAARAATLVRALLEVLAGDRPLQQLMRWVTPEVLTQVEDLVCPSGPRPWACSLQRLLVSEPADGVAEVCAIVRRGERSTAMALRLEGLDGRWLLTALQLG
jgi:hypothetical protein